MITNQEIQQIHTYIEAEILFGFGSKIFAPAQPAIIDEEVQGIKYLTQWLDDPSATKEFKLNSVADYLQIQIRHVFNDPMIIFYAEQRQPITIQSDEIKIHIQTEIYKFLQKYQTERTGLQNFSEVKDFLSTWLNKYEKNLPISQQLLLEREIQFYEQVLQQLPDAVERTNRFSFYFIIFLVLGSSGVMGSALASFFKFGIGYLTATLSVVGIGGAVWVANSEGFKAIKNFIQSLPADMRSYSNPILIHQINEKLKSLNGQLKELQQSQLGTTVQLLQKTLSQDVVTQKAEASEKEGTKPPQQLTHRSAHSKKTDEDYKPESKDSVQLNI